MNGWRLGRVVMGGLATAVFMLPLYWAGVVSLRPLGLPPLTAVPWWPADPQWSNYQQIFRTVPMLRYLSNSLLVVATAVPLTLLTASLAGLALAQTPEPQRRRLLWVSIVLLLIPGTAVWLFRFQILRWLGLLDSLWALIVPAFAASNPLFVLLFYVTFQRIPAELYEAARLDGAQAWMIWWGLALPLARPTAVAVSVLTFVLYWSDFVSPVLYIFNPRYYTLPVGLQLLKQLDATNWPLLMAAAILMTLPIALLFIGLQQLFLQPLRMKDEG